MAKKIENKYLWYMARQVLSLSIALAAIGVCIYYIVTDYSAFFNSEDPQIFWIGYLIIACIIIAIGITILSTALTIKTVFYIKMGYRYVKNEAEIYDKQKGESND